MQRPASGPRTRQLALGRLRAALRAHMDEDAVVTELEDAIPDAWATLEADVPCAAPKVKVTLYLDATVAKFFRAMGRGYQDRINRLLRVYAQAKIAEVRWFDEAWDREVAASAREARDGRGEG